jgi:hypothetical protein
MHALKRRNLAKQGLADNESQPVAPAKPAGKAKPAPKPAKVAKAGKTAAKTAAKGRR